MILIASSFFAVLLITFGRGHLRHRAQPHR